VDERLSIRTELAMRTMRINFQCEIEFRESIQVNFDILKLSLMSRKIYL
jgi:hypothetical protein